MQTGPWGREVIEPAELVHWGVMLTVVLSFFEIPGLVSWLES